jgi:hypothetical protein
LTIKTPFEFFSDDVDARVAVSNQGALDCVIRQGNGDGDLFSIFSWKDIQRMGKAPESTSPATSTRNEDIHPERIKFADAFAKAGMIVVRFDPDDTIAILNPERNGCPRHRSPRKILSSMWCALRDFFFVVNFWNLQDSLHHQSLPGPSSQQSSNENDCGYRYVQTYMNDGTGRVVPNVIDETMQLFRRRPCLHDNKVPTDILETWKVSLRNKLRPPSTAKATCFEDGHDDALTGVAIAPVESSTTPHSSVIEETFYLLNEPSLITASVAWCGARDQRDPACTQQLVMHLLTTEDAHGEKNGCLPGTSMQRLAQYVTCSSQQDNCVTEGLTSHTDWSLMTAIPVSPVPGLHIWISPTWFSPEDILHQLTDKDSSSSSSSSNYCTLMAGKWLEILTRQKIPACIHRVVSADNNQTLRTRQRLSAPFFLRPISKVAEQVRTIPHSVHGGNHGRSTNVATAVEELQRFLLEKDQESVDSSVG